MSSESSVALAALYYQATRDLETQKATVAGLQLEIAKEVGKRPLSTVLS
jgi:hypothetical protein